MAEIKTSGSRGEDSDLADLIGNNNGNGNTEKEPLASGGKTSSTKANHNVIGGLCQLLCAHISYLCFAYPKCCGGLACVIAFVIVLAVIVNGVNPNSEYGEIKHDWASVNSIYELDVGKIDHWCLGGGNEGCRCEDPLVPASRVELRSWSEAYKDNIKMIQKYMDDPLLMKDLDMAILGESAVEEMDGRWMGRRPDDELRNIGTIFHNHFRKDLGAQIEAVALGIAGDSANNVLWRLLHGEMPDGFEPKIWWVSVGMNDLTRMQCSEEVVVLGVLRVVEEILKKRPKARVVINSLLPMADLRGGPAVDMKDYRDAFATYKGKQGNTPSSHYVRAYVGNKETLVKAPAPADDSDADGGRRLARTIKERNRQLLERALESYMKNQHDNSDEIELHQRNLEAELSIETGIDGYREVAQKQMERELSSADKYNPEMDQDAHRQKKYQFFRKRRMPLWTSIYAINQQLFKFCEKHPTVGFFDATNIFAERSDHNGGTHRFFTLKSDLISARGHPTELGYLQWEDAIVKHAVYLLGEMRKTSPELFTTTEEGIPINQAHPGSSGTTDYGQNSGDAADNNDVTTEAPNAGGDGDGDDDAATDEGAAQVEGYSTGSGADVASGGTTTYGGMQQEPVNPQQQIGYPPNPQSGTGYPPNPQSGMQQNPNAYQQDGMQQGAYGQNPQQQGGMQQGAYGQNPQQQYGMQGAGGGSPMGYQQQQQQQQQPGQYYSGQQQQQQPGQTGFEGYQGQIPQGGAGGYPGQQQQQQQQQPGMQAGGGYAPGGFQQQGVAGSSYQQPGQSATYGGYQGMQQQQPGMQGQVAPQEGQQQPGAGTQSQQGGYWQQQPAAGAHPPQGGYWPPQQGQQGATGQPPSGGFEQAPLQDNTGDFNDGAAGGPADSDGGDNDAAGGGEDDDAGGDDDDAGDDMV